MDGSNEIVRDLAGLSYGGIFLVALTANIVIPVPEEVTLLATGFLVAKGVFEFLPTAFLFVTGMMISDTILYNLAKRGTKYLEKLKKRINKNRYLRDSQFVRKHIKKIIVISRFVIYFRFIGPVLAGTTKTPYKTFIFYDTLALILYVPFVLFLGDYFQNNIQQIIEGGAGVLRNYLLIAVGVIVLAIFFRRMKKSLLREISYKIDEYKKTIIPGLVRENKNYQDELKRAQAEEKKIFKKKN